MGVILGVIVGVGVMVGVFDGVAVGPVAVGKGPMRASDVNARAVFVPFAIANISRPSTVGRLKAMT